MNSTDSSLRFLFSLSLVNDSRVLIPSYMYSGCQHTGIVLSMFNLDKIGTAMFRLLRFCSSCFQKIILCIIYNWNIFELWTLLSLSLSLKSYKLNRTVHISQFSQGKVGQTCFFFYNAYSVSTTKHEHSSKLFLMMNRVLPNYTTEMYLLNKIC